MLPGQKIDFCGNGISPAFKGLQKARSGQRAYYWFDNPPANFLAKFNMGCTSRIHFTETAQNIAV